MRSSQRTILALAICAATFARSAAADNDVVQSAMRDELKRAMDALQLEDLEKPYFISYKIDDTRQTNLSASFGALVSSDQSRERWLSIEVRVGDYDLDNTNFVSTSFGRSGVARMFGDRVRLAIENDYREIRRAIWLATDSVYKRAVEDLASKRAALKNMTRDEELPDFSREARLVISDVRPSCVIELQHAEEITRSLSRLTREMREVSTSEVVFEARTTVTRYINSEGSEYERVVPTVGLSARAGVRAVDGRPLKDFVAFYGACVEDLPAHEELVGAVRRMGKRLAALRTAPILERYNGPVLFEAEAAAEFFAQVLAPSLLASRRPIAATSRVPAFASGSSSSFEDKIGARVLARSMHVTDDPTLSEYDGQVLVAAYKVDDEAVATRPTKLIQRGILKTLLSGRTPVTGVEASSANQRGGRVLPSNLVVSTDDGASREQIEREMIELVKERELEFGIVVRRIGNPDQRIAPDAMRRFLMLAGAAEPRAEPLIEAYKFYPDGREELIRNAELSGLSTAVFRDIVAVSRERVVYTAPFRAAHGPRVRPFGFGFRATGQPVTHLVTWVMPALLFEELTLRKPSRDVPRPPVIPHPFFEVRWPESQPDE
jgi:predicted Zn-dependent protease